MKLISMGRFLP